jgi:hypothetical protein
MNGALQKTCRHDPWTGMHDSILMRPAKCAAFINRRCGPFFYLVLPNSFAWLFLKAGYLGLWIEWCTQKYIIDDTAIHLFAWFKYFVFYLTKMRTTLLLRCGWMGWMSMGRALLTCVFLFSNDKMSMNLIWFECGMDVNRIWIHIECLVNSHKIKISYKFCDGLGKINKVTKSHRSHHRKIYLSTC